MPKREPIIPTSAELELTKIAVTDVPYIPDRLTLPMQLRLADLILAEERRASTKGFPVVADRTIVDGAIYVRWGAGSALAERLVEHVRGWLETYDHLVLCSPEGIPYEPDSVRTESSEDRDTLHQIFLDAFEELGIAYDLLEGDQRQRHDYIAGIVDDLK